MAVLPSKSFAVPDHVLVREVGGESVLLNLQSETYFGLDETGTRIWTALTRYPSVDEACRALLSEFDVEPERLERDVAELAGTLVEKGLLAPSGDHE